MDFMNILIAVLLAVLLMALLYYGLGYFFRATAPPPQAYRMLVAVRKSSAGNMHFLDLDESAGDKLAHDLQYQWNLLHNRLLQYSTFESGFSPAQRELDSRAEPAWQLFGFYNLPNHENFRRCQAILEQPEFRKLRNYCDIRLIFGYKNSDFGQEIRELF